MRRGTGRWPRAAAVGLAALSVVGAAHAQARDDAAGPSPREMAEEIRELKARIERLETETGQPSQAEVDAVVERVLRDAEARSHLIPPGEFGITYTDGRLIIANRDRSFVAHPWAQVQVRNSVNWREGAGAGGSDDVQNGFEIRRARFGIDGNLTRDISYLIAGGAQRGNTRGTAKDSDGNTIGSAANPVGGMMTLEEAWVRYDLSDTPWGVRAGQMHGPFSHESIIGSRTRMMDSSLSNFVFANSDNYLQAVTLIYEPEDSVRVEGGVTDGIRSANTSFQDFPTPGILYDFGGAGRVEYKAFGRWQDYNQLSAIGNKEDLLVYGFGTDVSEGGDTNTWTETLDVQYTLTSGLSVYGSTFARYITNNPGIVVGVSPASSGRPPVDTFEYSASLQVAYLIRQKWEPYVRAEYLWVQGTPPGSENAVPELTAGLTYYIHGHNLKLTTRVLYLPEGIPFDDTGNDILQDSGKAELVFSTQLQLLL